MCVSKVQHMTGQKTGCNWSRPVFFGFSIFRQTSQLATKKIQNLWNRNWWSGLLQLGSVRFRSFFQSGELDLRTLVLQDSSGLCPTLPSSAKLGRTGTEFGRISAKIKYIIENFKCHVTLSNNSLYTDNLILRIPQIFSFKEGKLNCIQ